MPPSKLKNFKNQEVSATRHDQFLLVICLTFWSQSIEFIFDRIISSTSIINFCKRIIQPSGLWLLPADRAESSFPSRKFRPLIGSPEEFKTTTSVRWNSSLTHVVKKLELRGGQWVPPTLPRHLMRRAIRSLTLSLGLGHSPRATCRGAALFVADTCRQRAWLTAID